MAQEAVKFEGWGFGVEPCPGCGKIPQPKEKRAVVPGEWRVYHEACFNVREALEELL